jgi:serine/threonine-protein kinase
MKRAEGPSLQALLETRGRFDEATAADLAAQVADALDHAHRQGVIHRDVKPSNILLDGRTAVLTDFGVARALDDPTLTATGLTVGTPAYMAPEQASGRADLDGRADLYSLGVVLYQMVTGRTPFWGSTPQVMHAHVYDPPPPPSSVAEVSPAMEAVILRAMAKNPEDRYPTGAALAADLRSLVEATHTRQPVVLRVKPSRRRTLRWGLAALLVASVLGGGVWLATSRPSPAPTPAPTSGVPATGPATGEASATPSQVITPSPSPPSAPSPSATASPSATLSPSATPTPTTPPPTPLPAATLTVVPLSPDSTPTACPQPIAAAFADWMAPDTTLAAQIGCPRGPAVQAAGAWEPFERGQMLWRGDLRQIYVLHQAGAWASYDDRWREGDPSWDASIVPPGGFMQPVRGFGLVWREQPGVRDALGWATASEVSFDSTFQPFERALLVADRSAARAWALFSDGTWLAGP